MSSSGNQDWQLVPHQWANSSANIPTDLYEILGVPKQATLAQITAAYRELARRCHPDRGYKNREMFQRIKFAYEVLSDERKRYIYDQINGPNTQQSYEDDLYGLLDVPKHATLAEITDAYRKLALRYHPDRGNADGIEMFQRVNYAYEVLSDERKRTIYDKFGGHNGLRILKLLDNAADGTMLANMRGHFNVLLSASRTNTSLGPIGILDCMKAFLGILFSLFTHPLTRHAPTANLTQQQQPQMGPAEVPQCVVCHQPPTSLCFACDPDGNVCGSHCDH